MIIIGCIGDILIAVILLHCQLQELGDVVEEGEGEDGEDVELPHREVVAKLQLFVLIIIVKHTVNLSHQTQFY